MNTHADFEFKVRSYECTLSGETSLASICNYLQECATLHARMLGFDRRDFAEQGLNISWILTRMRVQMNRHPRWQDIVRVTTFPRAGRRITVYRDFELRIGDELIGVATSEWMVIDLTTRKIAPIPQFVFDLANDEHPPVIDGEPFARLRWNAGEIAGARDFETRRADIDLNGHVNNVHYIEWLNEAVPEAAPIADFEIVFKAETLAGERIRAESTLTAAREYLVRVASPDGKDHALARFVLAGTPAS